MKESYVDVCIIGSGPSGLVCGLGLTREGVTVRVVDKRSSRVEAGHADGLQPRTIEVMQSYGLAERVLKEANQMHMAAFYTPGPSGGIEFTHRCPAVSAPTARYPFKATLHQGAIEQMFLDSLATMDVHIDRPTVPVSMSICDDQEILNDPGQHVIRVVMKHLDEHDPDESETEVVHCKFLVGADGAHSWVRKFLGIEMVGEQSSYVWGVVDMEPETDFPDVRNWSGIKSSNGSCMIIPREDNKVRLYIQLEEDEAERVDKADITPEKLLEVARKTLQPFTMKPKGPIDWWTIYKIGQRVARSFAAHQNRVFLVGDATHTHSPKAGQGMNASMNDSHNLAWKIAYCLKRAAGMALLATYEFERRQYAQDLINFDKRFSSLFSGKPRTELHEDGVLHEDFLQAYKTFGGFTSGISVRYGESIIVKAGNQSTAKYLRIGERMPPYPFVRACDSRPTELQDLLPSDGRFKILFFLGNMSSPAQRQRVFELVESLQLLSRSSFESLFDVIAIGASQKGELKLRDLPESLHQYWSKVLLDDIDPSGRMGGNGYKVYGIEDHGATVIVRPDGYVGMVAPYEKVDDIRTYFAGFLLG